MFAGLIISPGPSRSARGASRGMSRQEGRFSLASGAGPDCVKFFTRYAILIQPVGWTYHSRMSKDDDDSFLARSTRSFQQGAEQSGPAASASYTLIGAIILLGGLGYVVDRWRGTSPWFLLAGLLLGLIVGFVDLARFVWKK